MPATIFELRPFFKRRIDRGSFRPYLFRVDSVRPEPDGERDDAEEPDQRRRLERVFREAFRRAIEKGVEAGVGTLSKADKAVRGVVDDVPLPKEVLSFVFQQIAETKNSLVRVVAGEVRDFLEATDVASELQRALTSLSFEIKTEVRFIPNDAGGGTPLVRAKAIPTVKRDKSDKDKSDKSDPTSEEE